MAVCVVAESRREVKRRVFRVRAMVVTEAGVQKERAGEAGNVEGSGEDRTN